MTFVNEIVQFQISLDGNVTEMKWRDGHIGRFHAKWLRFNCRCGRCHPKIPGVYLIDIEKFSDTLVMTKARLKVIETQQLEIEYQDELFEDHVTILPSDWLRKKCYCDKCLDEKLKKSDVITRSLLHRTKVGMQNIPTIQFKDMEEQGFFQWIKLIIEEGFCLIKNTPTEDAFLKELVSKVSHLEISNYGELFEVKVTGEDNAAYTNSKLPLHQDQPNYETPPGIQFLHCLKFDECISGGESKLVDLFQIVEILREESPDDFQTLVEVPSIFTTVDYDRGVYFESYKHHVVLDYFGKVVAVHWHPSLENTAQIKECDVDRYYKAHKKFLQIVRREEIQFKFRLQPGDMICFSNRRMLHAREEFQSNGGVRHLHGCYIRNDDMKCKYMTLAHKLGIEVSSPKVGNNSSI